MHVLLQAEPDLPECEPAVVEEFEAAPWLLPPRTRALPYAGIHKFEDLLALRSRPAGGYDKAIAMLLFSRTFAVMAQNSSALAAAAGAAAAAAAAAAVACLLWRPDGRATLPELLLCPDALACPPACRPCLARPPGNLLAVCSLLPCQIWRRAQLHDADVDAGGSGGMRRPEPAMR